MSRLTLTALVALTLAARPQGASPPATLEAEGIHNLFRVTANLYSGSGPEGEKAFAALAKLGVKTVISVDGAKPDLENAKKQEAVRPDHRADDNHLFPDHPEHRRPPHSERNNSSQPLTSRRRRLSSRRGSGSEMARIRSRVVWSGSPNRFRPCRKITRCNPRTSPSSKMA
jgi:hypothetical protein